MDECKPLARGQRGRAAGDGAGAAALLGLTLLDPGVQHPAALVQGRAVQVDPIKPTLKAPGMNL